MVKYKVINTIEKDNLKRVDKVSQGGSGLTEIHVGDPGQDFGFASSPYKNISIDENEVLTIVEING